MFVNDVWWAWKTYADDYRDAIEKLIDMAKGL